MNDITKAMVSAAFNKTRTKFIITGKHPDGRPEIKASTHHAWAAADHARDWKRAGFEVQISEEQEVVPASGT